MSSRRLQLRLWMEKHAVYPCSKLATVTVYLLAIDVLLFLVKRISVATKRSFGESLSGWVLFLSLVVIGLLWILIVRRVATGLLWRLRNRLIVTYVFIGVIPFILLVALFLGGLYLLAGQFASFVATSRLDSALVELNARAEVLSRSLASEIEGGRKPANVPAAPMARNFNAQTSVWLGHELLFNESASEEAVKVPGTIAGDFTGLARDGNRVFLRVLKQTPTRQGVLTVIESQALDSRILANIAPDLGEVVSGDIDPKNQGLIVKFSSGGIPDAARTLDSQVSFATKLPAVNWSEGGAASEAAWEA
jgi:sigma-B regulation protein RsbU (phosphoserine phosphatase)